MKLCKMFILIPNHFHHIHRGFLTSNHPYSSGQTEKVEIPPSPTVSEQMKPKPGESCATQELEKVLLDPPTNCCMSGCNNCVWITYAEELAKLSRDGGEQARRVIEKSVTDPCLKAFLLTELKMR